MTIACNKRANGMIALFFLFLILSEVFLLRTLGQLFLSPDDEAWDQASAFLDDPW